MKYLATILILIAMVAFVLGFSASLRTSAQMLEDARVASTQMLKSKMKHRRRHPAPVQAGGALELPPSQ